MAFYIGQRVECVDADPECGRIFWPGEQLRLGQIYTVAAIVDNPSGYAAIAIREVPRHSIAVSHGYRGFKASRFRPIVERKTDISIFKAMLNPSKQEVSA